MGSNPTSGTKCQRIGKGLTKETDERIARAAIAHIGLKYKRKHLNNKSFTWTPELAYAVGLITTDGCLSGDGRHLEFTSKDFDQIQTFRPCLGITAKTSRKTSGYNAKKSSFHIQFSTDLFVFTKIIDGKIVG